MNDKEASVDDLKKIVKKFCDERNWRQFHNAKELAIGISTESGELLDHFRFKSNEEIEKLFENESRKQKISHELVDVLYFVLRFAEIYDIDLSESLKKKIELNHKKYPVEKAKDCNKKYLEY
jgi:NTP pyrophosphatase (non-canonical NTP hydrolase)